MHEGTAGQEEMAQMVQCHRGHTQNQKIVHNLRYFISHIVMLYNLHEL